MNMHSLERARVKNLDFDFFIAGDKVYIVVIYIRLQQWSVTLEWEMRAVVPFLRRTTSGCVLTRKGPYCAEENCKFINQSTNQSINQILYLSPRGMIFFFTVAPC